MNERIKDLLGQATTVEHGVIQPRQVMTQYHVDHEKFAELIVRECVGIVQPYMSRWPEDAELTKRIKEHFGVE